MRFFTTLCAKAHITAGLDSPDYIQGIGTAPSHLGFCSMLTGTFEAEHTVGKGKEGERGGGGSIASFDNTGDTFVGPQRFI